MSISDSFWWCWIVLAGTFYISFAVDGYNFAFGIFKLEIEIEYNGTNTTDKVNKASIAVIGGLVPALYCLLAPIAFGLVAVFSVRSLTICGALLSTFGFLLAYANQYLEWGFGLDVVALGVIQGIASALLYGPSINMIPTYFRLNRRALATGITTCGSPAGAIAYGFLMHVLIDGYTWRGSMLFFAGFSGLIVLAGLTFIPKTEPKKSISPPQQPPPNKSAQFELTDAFFGDDLYLKKQLSVSDSGAPILEPLLLEKQDTKKSTKERLREEFKNIFNRELFTDYVFITLLVAMAFSILGYYVPTLLITGQAKEPKFHVSKKVQDYLVSLWGVANLFGRLFVGWLADLGRFSRFFSSLSLFVIGLLASAACLLIFPHFMIYGDAAFISFVVVYGFFSAPFITLRSTIVQDLYYDRKKQIASSFGWTLWAEGLVIVAEFPLATLFNSIDPIWAYVFAAGSFMLSALCLVVSLRHYCRMYHKKIADQKLEALQEQVC